VSRLRALRGTFAHRDRHVAQVDVAGRHTSLSMMRARSTMRASRLVRTLSVTPIAEIKKIGVSAT